MYESRGYVVLSHERYPNQKLDMHNSETSECVRKSITALLATRAKPEETKTEELTACSNAIDLRRTTNADELLLNKRGGQ
jgi:hypothetical protein